MIKDIISLQNPLIKHLLRLRIDCDYRYEQQALMIEGLKPIREVPPSFIQKIIYIDPSLIREITCSEMYKVTESIMKKISGMVSPEGIIAEVKMPPFSSLAECKSVIALDGVNDPGNMGTLLRTALALGWEGVYLLPNCCDPFNDKVIRAARGAHFKLFLEKGTADQLKHLMEQEGWQPLAADIKGGEPDKIPKANGRLLVLGNEARGVSDEISAFCNKVSIPMPGKMESLNVAVAGGILMYLLRRNES